MRRLFTLLVAATIAMLGIALTAGPAAAQETQPVGTSTVSVLPAAVGEFAAAQVAVEAVDGATRTVTDGQVSIEFPVVGDPSDGTLELSGALQLTSATATLTIADLVVDTTAGLVTGTLNGGRIDVFTLTTGADGSSTLAFTAISAFGLNATFGTTFETGEVFGTAVTAIG